MLELARRQPAGAETRNKEEHVSATSGRSIMRRRLGRDVRDNLPWMLMSAPAVLWISIFSYIPMFGLIIAFKDYRNNPGILGSRWVGLGSFRYLFATKAAREITFNTLFMSAVFIITTLIASLLVALLMYQVHGHVLTRFCQSALFFPYFISYVALCLASEPAFYCRKKLGTTELVATLASRSAVLNFVPKLHEVK